MILSNVEVKYDENQPLNGAFAHLQTSFKKTSISDGVVRIRTKSTVQNLALPIENKSFENIYWCSKNERESWYEVDFLQNTFYLTSYVIRDYHWDFFEKWQVLGSNDGRHYDVVDDVTDFKQPSYGFHNYHKNCTQPKARRMFRIVAYGKRFYNDFFFVIHRLEFYGKFVSRLPYLSIRQCRSHISNIFIIISFMISADK